MWLNSKWQPNLFPEMHKLTVVEEIQDTNPLLDLCCYWSQSKYQFSDTSGSLCGHKLSLQNRHNPKNQQQKDSQQIQYGGMDPLVFSPRNHTPKPVEIHSL